MQLDVLPRAARAGGGISLIVRGSPPESLVRARRGLPLIGATAVEVADRDLPRLLDWVGPNGVWPDRAVRASLGPARHLARAAVQDTFGLTGANVAVALIDSGVEPHPDLEGALASFVDFVEGRLQPYDDYGHGTHLAGVIAGRGRVDSRFRGMAPGATLCVLKVLNHEGIGRESTIIEALQWCLRKRKELGIRIVNLSLGGSVEGPWVEDPLCQAVEAVWREGLTVVTTAGNEGLRGPASIRSPGVTPSVITVGAANQRRRVANFSSRGPTGDHVQKPDIVAPGTGVVSLRAEGSYLDGRFPRNRHARDGYFRQSGSSVATAVVAGALALVLEATPGAAPADVKRWLASSAQDLGEECGRQGAGLLDVARLLETALADRGQGEAHLGSGRSFDVWAAQNRLNLLGYTGLGPATGVLGRRAKTVLRLFQREHGLPEHGLLDARTRDALRRATVLGARVLRRGAVGEDVLVLQTRLRALGFAVCDPPQRFGASTERAVLAFQTASGALACGVVDRHTFYALGFPAPEMRIRPAGFESDLGKN